MTEHHDVTATRRMHGRTPKVHVVVDGVEVVLGGKRAERAAGVIVARWDKEHSTAGVYGLRGDLGIAMSEAERLTSTRPFRHRNRFTGQTYESPRNPAAYAVAVPVLNALADEHHQPKEAHDMSDTTTTNDTTKEQDDMTTTTTPPDGTPAKQAMKALNPPASKPRKASTKKATAAPKVERNKVDRIKAAGQESKAAKAAGWKRNKDTGEWERFEGRKAKPPTPNLDAINAGDAGESSTTAKAKGAGRPRSSQTVRLFHDGKPMPNSQNKISSVAYYHTKGVTGSKPRITTDALRKILTKETKLSEADLLTHAWSVTLANGVVLSAKVERKAAADTKAA